jgi:hypothetical protein
VSDPPSYRDIVEARRQQRIQDALNTPPRPVAQPGPYVESLCAAIANGCMSFLVVPVRDTGDGNGCSAINRDSAALELLRRNGWHVDHGRWVCGLHERRPCTCRPDSAAFRSGGVCSGEDWCEHCALAPKRQHSSGFVKFRQLSAHRGARAPGRWHHR